MGTGKNKDTGALVPRADYEVGYGKPPKATRFKPGQSGNPKGRPKGAKNKHAFSDVERMKDIILDEAYRDISVNEGDGRVTIPMAQAVIRSLAVNSAKGQHLAQRLFTELLTSTERSRAALKTEIFETAFDYKKNWERELARRDVLGITDLPPPLPHPDHVILDIRSGTVRLVGPATKEEQVKWEAMLDQKATLEECIAELIELNEIITDPQIIEENQRCIDLGTERLQQIERRLS